MAAPFFSTPFQPYVYQSHQGAVIPFQILGGEAQMVQIMLKPQEKIIAKPGSMCFMSGSIEMENILIPENEVGVWQWLFGKAVTSVIFRNPGPSDGFVGIATPSLARILPIDLAKFGGEILCLPDAFLCSINDVKVSNALDHRARNVMPNIEGFLRQKLTGQGLAFILAGGSVAQKVLEVGEVLAVDVSCIAALSTTVNVQIKYNGPVRRAVFGCADLRLYTVGITENGWRMRADKVFSCLGGDNLVTATLTGPGIVFIQSLPFQLFSQRIARAVTSPNMRENPKFFVQIAIFFFLAYVVIVSSLILTDLWLRFVTKETETTGTEGMAVDALDSTSTMLQSHILAGEEHETTES
ncbi:hypothetical protein POTOM_013526 [Populus tomentosa]|uniref:Altered inheritance of mitochondria protein 24, mitochondrial n=1 Tax=Populus tomentosa TaxID=118781 RepID=A0A8X8A2V9_POPTO|nr:hypothetical protein POTOM_013526 [Populus tomentosa]